MKNTSPPTDTILHPGGHSRPEKNFKLFVHTKSFSPIAITITITEISQSKDLVTTLTTTTNNKHGSNTCQYIGRLTRCQTIFTYTYIVHCISILGLEVFVFQPPKRSNNKLHSQQRRSICRCRWPPETNRCNAGKFGSMVRSTFDLVSLLYLEYDEK